MTWAIIVHGGAGQIDDSRRAEHEAGCRRAVEAGRRILESSGSAIDAACAAVRVLEDDPSFNAGIGATLDEDGMVTTDAAIFRGDDLAYGAIGAVAGVRRPIDLARAVLEDGRHSLLVAAGAVAFARKKGVELWDPQRMVTDPSRSKWWFTEAEERKRQAPPPPGPAADNDKPEGDTVGAVARDSAGSIVAATSTGGLLRKYAGRVGDSPIAGAGTYARNDLGGVSATGHGETIMKTVLAYQALRALQAEIGTRPDTATDPAQILLRELEDATARAGGRGGLIAVLPDGRVAHARNTLHMGCAWATSAGLYGSDF